MHSDGEEEGMEDAMHVPANFMQCLDYLSARCNEAENRNLSFERI